MAEELCGKSRHERFRSRVSGGIDSAVVSTLAAMTGMKTLVLEMPIRQKEDQVNRAQEHIDFLKTNFPNVDGFRVDLTLHSILSESDRCKRCRFFQMSSWL